MTAQSRVLTRMWIHQPKYNDPFSQYNRDLVLADLEDEDEDGHVKVYFLKSSTGFFTQISKTALQHGWDVASVPSKKFQLSLTHAKAIVRELGRDGLGRFLDAVNNQPEFLKKLGEFEDVYDIMSVHESGCSGSAHAAAYYKDAFDCVMQCHESVEEMLEGAGLATPQGEAGVVWNPTSCSFKGFMSTICQTAVEAWVANLYEFTEIFAKEGY